MSSEMQRYDVVFRIDEDGGGFEGYRKVQDANGAYVLYADAQRLLEAEREKVKTLRSVLAHIANTRDNYEKRIIAEKALSDTEGQGKR